MAGLPIDLRTTYQAAVSGDINDSRLSNVGTAGTYGTTSRVPIITTDTKGRVSGVTTTTLDGAVVTQGGFSNIQSITVSNVSCSNSVIRTITASNVTVSNLTVSTGPIVFPAGSIAASALVASGATAGTYGSATAIPTVTVNSQGLITGISTTAVFIPATSGFAVSGTSTSTACNVGIGTTNFTGTLCVFSSNTNHTLQVFNSGAGNAVAVFRGNLTGNVGGLQVGQEPTGHGFIYNYASGSNISYGTGGTHFFNGAMSLNSNLTVGGSATFNSGATFTGGLTVNNNTSVFNGSTSNTFIAVRTPGNNQIAGLRLHENNGDIWGGGLIYDGSNDKLQLGMYNGSTTFTPMVNIGYNGHVGIGTTNPQWATHLANTGGNVITNTVQLAIMHPSMTAPFFFEHSQTGTAHITNYVANATTALVSLGALELWSSNAIGTKITNNFNTNKALSVSGGVTVGSSYNNTTTPANGMIVQGFVGIGLSNPTSALHVNGPSQGFGNNTATVVQIQHPNAGSPALHMTAVSDGGSTITNYNPGGGITIQTIGGTLALSSSTTNMSGINANIYSSNANGTVVYNNFSTANKSLAVSGGVTVGSAYNNTTTPANGMIVQGNVGIGLSNPATALEVNGSAIIRNNLSFPNTYGTTWGLSTDVYHNLTLEPTAIASGATPYLKIVGDVTSGTETYSSGIVFQSKVNIYNNWILRGPVTNRNSCLELMKDGNARYRFDVVNNPVSTGSNAVFITNAVTLNQSPGTANPNDIVSLGRDPNIGSAVLPWYGIGVANNIIQICGWSGINFRTGGGSNASVSTFCVSSTGPSGSVGIGITNPSTYQLQLSTDLAAKTASSTWATTSDARVKIDIVTANVDRCYDIVKQLDLKFYKYRDDIIDNNAAPDRRRLGWIAQEVETIFPKAVVTSSNYGLDDCKSLNVDQIYAAMYGCIKKIQQSLEMVVQTHEDIKVRLTNLENKSSS